MYDTVLRLNIQCCGGVLHCFSPDYTSRPGCYLTTAEGHTLLLFLLLFLPLFTQHHKPYQSWRMIERNVKSLVSLFCRIPTAIFRCVFETQNWEWSISSSHEAGLVGKSGYPVLLPVERSEVGPPAMALRACPTPPGPPCAATRLSMLKPRLLRRGVWPGTEVMEEGD